MWTKRLWTAAFAAGMTTVLAAAALAHCDTTSGPIIPEAKAALERGDVTPVLKWVQKDDEAAIKAAFTSALAVRSQGPEAKKLADQYFLETLIRLHRAGEGAPYTGIKDEPAGPVITMAEDALAAGSADELIDRFSRHLATVIRERFAGVANAAKEKDDSVEAGRAYVAAYVTYMHYVEGLHDAIVATGAHHAEAGAGAGAHQH